jgi:hypothetical protein
MKRNAALVVALIGLVAVISLRANVTAQDDAVPVLQTQVADLETRVAALEGAAASPAVGVTVVASNGTSHAFSGTGDQVVNVGSLASGAYKISGTFSHPGSVTIRLVSKEIGYTTGVIWEITNPDARWEVVTIQPDYGGTFVAEVHAVGDWTISIEPVS